MKIKIKDIKSKGLNIKEDIEPIEIGLSDDDLRCLSLLTIQADLKRVDNTILAHTQIEGVYVFYCSRCLEEIENKRSQSFDFDYLVQSELETIDLGEDIRQEMILNLPTKILCSETCKGICVGCGVNLNKEVCRCNRKFN